jgi:hypothetical protein
MGWDSGFVPEELVTTLDRDWSFVGEVNQMRAYNRPGKAVCFLQWENSWRVFAGAVTKRDFLTVTDFGGVAASMLT